MCNLLEKAFLTMAKFSFPIFLRENMRNAELGKVTFLDFSSLNPIVVSAVLLAIVQNSNSGENNMQNIHGSENNNVGDIVCLMLI